MAWRECALCNRSNTGKNPCTSCNWPFPLAETPTPTSPSATKIVEEISKGRDKSQVAALALTKIKDYLGLLLTHLASPQPNNEQWESKKDELSAIVHILLLKYAEAAIAGTSYYPSPRDDPHLEWKGLHQQYYNALANYGCNIYKFHHPELLTLSTEFFEIGIQRLIRLPPEKRDAALKNVLETKHLGVASLNLFTQKFCELLLDELKSLKKEVPFATFDHLGFFVEQIGMRPFMDSLTEIVQEVSGFKHSKLTFSTSSIVFYDESCDGHQPHKDSTDLTLSVCLGDTFEGGELCIHGEGKSPFPTLPGRKREIISDAVIGTFPQHKGSTYLHSGEVVHSTNRVSSGERWNLIVWWKLESQFSSFLDLPLELQSHIISFTTMREFANLALLNSAFHRLMSSDELWRNLYLATFRSSETDFKPGNAEKDTDSSSWKGKLKNLVSAVTASPAKPTSSTENDTDSISWKEKFRLQFSDLKDTQNTFDQAMRAVSGFPMKVGPPEFLVPREDGSYPTAAAGRASRWGGSRTVQLPYSHGIRYETTDIGYGMRVPSPVLTERVTAHFVTIKSEQQNKKASTHRCFLQ